MATAQWGLKNDHDTADVLASAWVNDVADDLELTRWGWLSQAIADGADTDIASGADEAVAIKGTGALTAGRNLIVRTAAGGRWWFWNGTTGGFAVTVKTSAGTGIAVPAGYRALLACDGTNVILFVMIAASPSAYTQTYSTADRTHANATAATLTMTDGAGTNDNTIGAVTGDASVIAAFQEVVDEVNKLIADVADVKQLVNAVIDDLQAAKVLG